MVLSKGLGESKSSPKPAAENLATLAARAMQSRHASNSSRNTNGYSAVDGSHNEGSAADDVADQESTPSSTKSSRTRRSSTATEVVNASPVDGSRRYSTDGTPPSKSSGSSLSSAPSSMFGSTSASSESRTTPPSRASVPLLNETATHVAGSAKKCAVGEAIAETPDQADTRPSKRRRPLPTRAPKRRPRSSRIHRIQTQRDRKAGEALSLDREAGQEHRRSKKETVSKGQPTVQNSSRRKTRPKAEMTSHTAEEARQETQQSPQQLQQPPAPAEDKQKLTDVAAPVMTGYTNDPDVLEAAGALMLLHYGGNVKHARPEPDMAPPVPRLEGQSYKPRLSEYVHRGPPNAAQPYQNGGSAPPRLPSLQRLLPHSNWCEGSQSRNAYRNHSEAWHAPGYDGVGHGAAQRQPYPHRNLDLGFSEVIRFVLRKPSVAPLSVAPAHFLASATAPTPAPASAATPVSARAMSSDVTQAAAE